MQTAHKINLIESFSNTGIRNLGGLPAQRNHTPTGVVVVTVVNVTVVMVNMSIFLDSIALNSANVITFFSIQYFNIEKNGPNKESK